MRNFQKINKKEYSELFDRAIFKTFFHDPDWHNFLEQGFKWLKFEYHLYGGELLFPVAKVGDKLISLPFCEYGGPLPLKKDINFQDFKKDVLAEFQNIKIKFHPLVCPGDENSDVLTHFIENLDKRAEQEIWDSFRKTLRHSIRNAQENDFKIKKCSSPKELKQFYNLYVANLKKKKTVPYPFSIFKFLYGRPETEVLLAFHKNKIIAGDLFLHYDSPVGEAGKFIHYFFSASDYKYRDLGASYLILWEKIKSLIGKTRPDGRGFVFDLGASPKGSALEIFKRGWEGKEYPILQLGIKRSEESLRSSKLRNVWKLLPSWLIKILSSKLIKYRL